MNKPEQNTTLAALGDQQIPSLTTTNGSDSRFHALRQELGLSRANAPALRPRHNIDPFLIRLRPDQVRNEETLLAAVNDMVYNEQPVQMFMRLALTPAEATAVRDRQVAQVLSEFTDDSLTLRDALWYLEFVGWDVELAILQQLHDYIQRTEAPGPGSVQVDADFPAENLKLDRSPVLAGEDFDEEKLKVKYIQYGVERTKTYPDWLKVDRNNIHHIRALNKWRWKTIM